MWDMWRFSDEMKQRTALHVLALWQHSGSGHLADEYIRCFYYCLMDEATRQSILAAFTKLQMPLVEASGTNVVRTVFFPNGQPMDRIRGYVDKSGKFIRHGVCECWAEDGTRLFYGHFENDEYHGRRFEWNYDGKLSSIAAFSHGELSEYVSENLEEHPDFNAAQQLTARDGVPDASDP